MSNIRTYLGDGVFADVERGMIRLTTEDGIRATNTIFLEDEVVDALAKFVARVRAIAKANRGAT